MEKILIPSKFYFLMRNYNVLIFAFLITALIFKFMSWPGAAIVLTFSLAVLAVLLITKSINLFKTQDSLKFLPLLLSLLAISFLFKIMHWPAANILIITSMGGLFVEFVRFSINSRKSISALVPLAFGVSLVFVLFKVMHWPHSALFLKLIYSLFLVTSPLVLFNFHTKLKGKDDAVANQFARIGVLTTIYLLLEVVLLFFPEGLVAPHFVLRIGLILVVSLVLALLSKIRAINGFKERFKLENNFTRILSTAFLIVLLIQVLIAK